MIIEKVTDEQLVCIYDKVSYMQEEFSMSDADMDFLMVSFTNLEVNTTLQEIKTEIDRRIGFTGKRKYNIERYGS